MTKRTVKSPVHKTVIFKKISKFTDSNKKRLYQVTLAFSILILLVTTLYAAVHLTRYFSTDSDAIIATQQFSSGLSGHVVTLPGNHANFLIIPFLFIQAHLPYHYRSFEAAIVGLMLVTICAWAYLAIRLLGRKYAAPILLLMSCLVFTSVTFNINIGYDTLRNIEYPIALWFVFIVGEVLRKRQYSTKRIVWAIVGSALFTVVLAGDSLFRYAIILPLLVVIVWYWIQSNKLNKKIAKALGLIVLVVVGAVLLKSLLGATGIFAFDNNMFNTTTTVPASTLSPSIVTALKQLVQLQGGFISGQNVSLRNLYVIVDFGILIASVVGLTLILILSNSSFRNKKDLNDDKNQFVLTTMAVSYFAVFFVYILSNLVVTMASNGKPESLLDTRYISLMPFIGIIGAIWLLKRYFKDHLALVVLICVVLVASIVSSYSSVNSTYKLDTKNAPTPSLSSVKDIIGILNSNNVREAVTDYWYGPPIRFWSNNKINFAPEINCNQPLPFSTRQDWFIPSNGIKSALVIDRGSLNFGYWSCTNQQLVQIYGQPSKELSVPGINSNSPVDIWIYNYDVRSKLLPTS